MPQPADPTGAVDYEDDAEFPMFPALADDGTLGHGGHHQVGGGATGKPERRRSLKEVLAVRRAAKHAGKQSGVRTETVTLQVPQQPSPATKTPVVRVLSALPAAPEQPSPAMSTPVVKVFSATPEKTLMLAKLAPPDDTHDEESAVTAMPLAPVPPERPGSGMEGGRRLRSLWPRARQLIKQMQTGKRIAEVLKTLRSRQELLSTTFINLNDNGRVYKVINKAIRDVAADNGIETGALSPTTLRIEEVQEDSMHAADHFYMDNFVVIDYGTKWGANTDLSFKIGARHEPGPPTATRKVKATLMLVQQDDASEGGTLRGLSDNPVIGEDSCAGSHLVQYYKKSGKLYVASSVSQFAGKSGAGQTEQGVLLQTFIHHFMATILKRKRRRTAVRGHHQRSSRLESYFEEQLVAIKASSQRDRILELMEELKRLMLLHPDPLLTSENLWSLCRFYREAKAPAEIIALLTGLPADNPTAQSIRNSDTTKTYEAWAYGSRGEYDAETDADDLLLAGAIVERLVSSNPSSRQLQLLRGKTFKKLFCSSNAHAGRYSDDQLTHFYDHAIAAFEILSRSNVFDDEGSAGPESAHDREADQLAHGTSLVILLYLSDEYERAKFSIFQRVDYYCRRLAFKITRHGANFAESSAMFRVNFIAGYLFGKQTHFDLACKAAAEVFKSWRVLEQLNALLEDLKLLHGTALQRAELEPEHKRTQYDTRSVSFWVSLLESAAPEAKNCSLPRVPILFGEIGSVGATDMGELTPMFLTLSSTAVSDEPRSPAMRRATMFPPTSPLDRQASFGRQASFDNFNRARSGSGGAGRRRCSLSADFGPSSEPVMQHCLRLEPVSVGKGNFVEFAFGAFELQNLNLPRHDDLDVLDERYVLMSVQKSTDAEIKEPKAYQMVFGSEFQRQEFGKRCKELGYENTIGTTRDDLFKLPFEDIIFEHDDSGEREVLGEGGFAFVYLAYVRSDLAPVAVKSLKREFITDLEAIATFENEIKKLRVLQHENIVQFVGASKTPTDRLLLVEYVDGGSLDELLVLYGPLYNGDHPEQSCRSIALYTKQVVDAIAYLHENRYSHRDIKPGNVMVSTFDGVAKLTDFGTLKDVTGLEVSTLQSPGTLLYMDISVINRVAHGVEVDIYSLGATVFELAQGCHPFMVDGLDYDTVLERRRKGDSGILCNPVWPENLKSFVEACISDPSSRPSASELKGHAFLVEAPPNPAGLQTLPEQEHYNIIKSVLVSLMRIMHSDVCNEWDAALQRLNRDGKLGGVELPSRSFLSDALVAFTECIEGPATMEEVGAGDFDAMAKVRALLGDGSETDDERFETARQLMKSIRVLHFDNPSNNQSEHSGFPFWAPFLRSYQDIASNPHWLWVLQEAVNTTLNQISAEMFPLTAGSTLAPRKGRSRRLSFTQHSVGSASGWPHSMDVLDDVAGAEQMALLGGITDKLDALMDDLRQLMDDVGSRLSSQNVDTAAAVPGAARQSGTPAAIADPALLAAAREAHAPEWVALHLTNQGMTAEGLKTLSHDEMRKLGLPVGVVMLLCKCHNASGQTSSGGESPAPEIKAKGLARSRPGSRTHML